MDTKAQARSATHTQSHACNRCRCRRCSQSRGASPSPAGHCGTAGSQGARRRRTMRPPSGPPRPRAHSRACPWNRRQERKAKRWRRKVAQRSRCGQARRQSKGWK